MGYEIHGLDGMLSALGGLDASLDEVASEMLDAQSDIVVQAQKNTAATMLQGPFYKGGLSASVKKGRVRKTMDGHAVTISFEGKQHGNRLVEIAYVNEFGKTNQPGRPFIWTANEQSADAAEKAALDVLDKHMKAKGL